MRSLMLKGADAGALTGMEAWSRGLVSEAAVFVFPLAPLFALFGGIYGWSKATVASDAILGTDVLREALPTWGAQDRLVDRVCEWASGRTAKPIDLASPPATGQTAASPLQVCTPAAADAILEVGITDAGLWGAGWDPRQSLGYYLKTTAILRGKSGGQINQAESVILSKDRAFAPSSTDVAAFRTAHERVLSAAAVEIVHRVIYGKPARIFFRSIAAADLDSDGDVDLAAAGVDLASIPPYAGIVRLWLNDASRDWPSSAAVDIPCVEEASQLLLSDLDADGCTDLIVLGKPATGRGDEVSIIRGIPGSRGSFFPEVRLRLGADTDRIQVEDLNFDGFPDIVSSTAAGVRLLEQIPAAPGSFREAETVVVGKTSGLTAIRSSPPRIVELFFEQDREIRGATLKAGGSSFGASLAVASPEILTDWTMADLDGNGTTELLAVHYTFAGRCELLIYPRDAEGDGFSRNPLSYGIPGPVKAIATADVNGDERPDVITDSGMAFIQRLDAPGHFSKSSKSVSFGGPYLKTMVGVDIDGDGHQELVQPFFDHLAVFRGTYPERAPRRLHLHADSVRFSRKRAPRHSV